MCVKFLRKCLHVTLKVTSPVIKHLFHAEASRQQTNRAQSLSKGEIEFSTSFKAADLSNL